MIDMFNKMIAKALLGTYKITTETKYSDNASKEVQERIPKRKGQGIARKELMPAINVVLESYFNLNYNVVDAKKLPYYTFTYNYDPTLEEVHQAIEKQIPIQAKWYYDKFNIQAPEEEGEEPV